MKTRYRMFRRRSGIFYWQDGQTGHQGSLGTKDNRAAGKLLHAKNESFEQPTLNLAMARAYASAHDPKMASRLWSDVMAEMCRHGKASTQERCARATAAKAFNLIRRKALIATTSEDLLTVLYAGGHAVHYYLRRLHNLAVNLGWLAWPVLAKAGWPKIIPHRRRAITREEHERILGAERNPERRAFYQLLWHTGASQSDAAHLCAENIDRAQHILSYRRAKLSPDSEPARLTIGSRLESLLDELPSFGPLFSRMPALVDFTAARS